MRAHVVDDLREVSGRWVLCASSHGYFDSRPNVEQATLEYREVSPERMTFTARFVLGGKIRSLTGRQATTRGADGYFRFSGFGMLLRVARLHWDLALAENGEVIVAANAGSLVAPVGLLVFARDGLPWSRVNAQLVAGHRDFGISSSQMRLLTWRAESRRLGFPDSR